MGHNQALRATRARKVAVGRGSAAGFALAFCLLGATPCTAGIPVTNATTAQLLEEAERLQLTDPALIATMNVLIEESRRRDAEAYNRKRAEDLRKAKQERAALASLAKPASAAAATAIRP